MEITLTQGILLAVLGVITGLDFWLQAFYIFRPVIVCTLAGLILGDMQLGIVAGGLTELAFAGLTPAGGTQPPNPVLCGIMTVVIAHTTSTSPAGAIGMSLPFAFLMQYVLLFYYSSFSLFMPSLDKAAKEANARKFVRIQFMPLIIVTLSYLIIVFLSAYAAQAPMRALVTSLPEWLSHGFGIAGGILPAVGFAMLLKVMLKGSLVPYLIIGFVVASLIPYSNVLPAAAIGAALAMIEFFRDKHIQTLERQIENAGNMSGGEEDGI